MVNEFKLSIAKWLVPCHFKEWEDDHEGIVAKQKELHAKLKGVDEQVDQRVAQILLSMDPFEPLMQKYHGTFGPSYERPEDKLSKPGRTAMLMWGYAQKNDPSFEHFTQWILDTQGNAMVKKGNPTPETILFSRAMIAGPLLMREEIKRLASLYEEMMDDDRQSDFDSSVALE